MKVVAAPFVAAQLECFPWSKESFYFGLLIPRCKRSVEACLRTSKETLWMTKRLANPPREENFKER